MSKDIKQIQEQINLIKKDLDKALEKIANLENKQSGYGIISKRRIVESLKAKWNIYENN